MPAQTRVVGVLLDERPTDAAAPVAGVLLEEEAGPVSGILLDPDGGESQWDAEAAARRWLRARQRGDKRAERRLLVEVARSNDWHAASSPVPRTLAVSHTACRQAGALGLGKRWFGRTPRVSFSTMTTADAVRHLCAGGRGRQGKVCALNFANGQSVGGGYVNGATAQEEDLCRRMPTLYASLAAAREEGLYPFGPCTFASTGSPGRYSDVLYTKDVTMARSSAEEGFAWLPQAQRVTASLVTAAAPNVPEGEPHDPRLLGEAVESILLAPHVLDSGVATLVLGAWGCGAFGGEPADIAELFARALLDGKLGRLYREVHFAIPARRAGDRNTAAFREAFTRRGVRIADDLGAAARAGA